MWAPEWAVSYKTDRPTGRFHTTVLLEDGLIACWGNNLAGQCDSPAGIGKVRQISTGLWHNFALCEDGSIACRERPSSGECATPYCVSDACKAVAGDRFSGA